MDLRTYPPTLIGVGDALLCEKERVEDEIRADDGEFF
jgi:hypothetical protein